MAQSMMVATPESWRVKRRHVKCNVLLINGPKSTALLGDAKMLISSLPFLPKKVNGKAQP